MSTKEYGKMLKRIQILEDGRVPAKEVKDWKIEGKRMRITRKEYKRLMNEFELEGLRAQKGLWNLAREKILQKRGAIPKEEGDVIREHNAMHEENFLSSWLREDLVEKEERRKKVKERVTEEEEGKKVKREEERKRDGEKEENETVSAKRRCVGFISAEAFDIFIQGEDLESCGGVSWRIFWRIMMTCLIVSLSLGRVCLRCLL